MHSHSANIHQGKNRGIANNISESVDSKSNCISLKAVLPSPIVPFANKDVQNIVNKKKSSDPVNQLKKTAEPSKNNNPIQMKITGKDHKPSINTLRELLNSLNPEQTNLDDDGVAEQTNLDDDDGAEQANLDDDDGAEQDNLDDDGGAEQVGQNATVEQMATYLESLAATSSSLNSKMLWDKADELVAASTGDYTAFTNEPPEEILTQLGFFNAIITIKSPGKTKGKAERDITIRISDLVEQKAESERRSANATRDDAVERTKRMIRQTEQVTLKREMLAIANQQNSISTIGSAFRHQQKTEDSVIECFRRLLDPNNRMIIIDYGNNNYCVGNDGLNVAFHVNGGAITIHHCGPSRMSQQ